MSKGAAKEAGKGRGGWLSDMINGYFYSEVVGVLVPGKALIEVKEYS